MVPTQTELGAFLRALRLNMGLSQTEFAARIGMRMTTYGNIERGDHIPLTKTIERLAKAFSLDITQLLLLRPVNDQVERKTKLGRFIAAQRRKLGLRSSDLAKLIGSVAAIELEYETVSPKSVRRLAAALQVEEAAFDKFLRREKNPRNELGRLLRDRRKELGFSQEDVAEKMGCSRQALNHIELGNQRASNRALASLACVLDLQLEQLQGQNRKPLRRGRPPKAINPTTIGGFLLARRLASNLTRKELAQKAGLSIFTIYKTEYNLSPSSPHSLKQLAAALGCEIPAGMATE